MVDVITFKKLRENDACEDRYKHLAEKCEVLGNKGIEFAGVTVAEGAKTTLLDILKHNGLDDTLWALRCVEDDDRRKWLVCTASHAFAFHVLHIFEDKFPEDKRLREALEAVLLYRDGKVSKAELERARAAAWDAAWAAAGAAARAAAEAGDAGAAERKWQAEKLKQILSTTET